MYHFFLPFFSPDSPFLVVDPVPTMLRTAQPGRTHLLGAFLGGGHMVHGRRRLGLEEAAPGRCVDSTTWAQGPPDEPTE